MRMKKFKVVITRNVTESYTVEAENEDGARDKADDMHSELYANGNPKWIDDETIDSQIEEL